MSDWDNWDVLGTAGNNSDAPPDGFPEGMPYAAVNDAARELMAATARWWRDHNGSLQLTAAGGNLTIALNRTAASGTSTNAAVRSFIAQVPLGYTPGAAPTLAVNGLNALPLVTQNGNAVTSGSLVAGQTYLFVLVGSSWQVSGTLGVDIEIRTINLASGNDIRVAGLLNVDSVLTVGAENSSDSAGAIDSAAPLRISNQDAEGASASAAQLVNIALYHAGDEAPLGRVGFLAPTDNVGAGTPSTILALQNYISGGAINLYRNNGTVTPVAVFSSGILATTLRNPNGAVILDAGAAGNDLTLARPSGTGTGNVVVFTTDGDTTSTTLGNAGDDLIINADTRADITVSDHSTTVGGETFIDSTGRYSVDVAGNKVIDVNPAVPEVQFSAPSGLPAITITNTEVTLSNLRFQFPVSLFAVTFATSPGPSFPVSPSFRGRHVFVRDTIFGYTAPADSYATLDIGDIIGTTFPIGETTDIFSGVIPGSAPPAVPPGTAQEIPHLRLPGTATINGCAVTYTGPRPAGGAIRGTHIRVMKIESARYVVHTVGEPLRWASP